MEEKGARMQGAPPHGSLTGIGADGRHHVDGRPPLRHRQ
jgi:hypothetical protein